MVNFTYEKDAHNYYCYLKTGDRIYTGVATCSPEDYDFENENVGYFIAEQRAAIQYLKMEREKTNAQLAALMELRNVYIQNPFIAENDKSLIILRKRVKIKMEELQLIRDTIASYKDDLSLYLAEKDKMYNFIRKKEGAAN